MPGHDRSQAARPNAHTTLAAVNDIWKLSTTQELQISGFFRTYNLSLFSDFGDGLIRQSEFRTVLGGGVNYERRVSKGLTVLLGTDYEREAPRHDDLQHYSFYNPTAPSTDGPAISVDGSNVTIAPISPWTSPPRRALSPFFSYYLGWRRDAGSSSTTRTS